MLRLLKALGVAALLVAVMDLAAGPVRAQASSGSAMLTSVAVSQDSAGQTHIRLGFNQILPQYSIVANDIDKPLLGFADTVRGSSAAAQAKPVGLVQGLEFDQRDTVMTMKIVGSAALHVVGKTISGGQGLDLTITLAPKSTAEAAGGPAGSLPAHVERNPEDDEFDVVPLKYADISEVVGVISAGQPIKPNDNFTPQEPAFGSQGLGGNGPPANTALPQAPGAQDQAGSYGQMADDTIGVDRRLNAIILHGSREMIERLRQRIAKLDVPLQSVLFEAEFVELTEQAARNVGFNFNNANGQIGVATYQAGSYNSNSGFFGSSGTTPLTSYQLQTALYAQVSKGQGRIVSKPRISAQSGVSAKIVTGDALPILTSITLSGVNGVSQQVQYVNVGVTLQIAPRISDDGYVTSKIFAEVSSVTGYSQGYPTISQREAETSATVKDGDSFVIGGLSQSSKLVTKGRVPGLGDIPVAGELFKLHQETGAKTELYIVLTPHIVRAGDAGPVKALDDGK